MIIASQPKGKTNKILKISKIEVKEVCWHCVFCLCQTNKNKQKKNPPIKISDLNEAIKKNQIDGFISFYLFFSSLRSLVFFFFFTRTLGDRQSKIWEWITWIELHRTSLRIMPCLALNHFETEFCSKGFSFWLLQAVKNACFAALSVISKLLLSSCWLRDKQLVAFCGTVMWF